MQSGSGRQCYLKYHKHFRLFGRFSMSCMCIVFTSYFGVNRGNSLDASGGLMGTVLCIVLSWVCVSEHSSYSGTGQGLCRCKASSFSSERTFLKSELP